MPIAWSAQPPPRRCFPRAPAPRSSRRPGCGDRLARCRWLALWLALACGPLQAGSFQVELAPAALVTGVEAQLQFRPGDDCPGPLPDAVRVALAGSELQVSYEAQDYCDPNSPGGSVSHSLGRIPDGVRAVVVSECVNSPPGEPRCFTVVVRQVLDVHAIGIPIASPWTLAALALLVGVAAGVRRG